MGILADLLKKAPQSVKDKYKIKIREKAIERVKEKLIKHNKKIEDYSDEEMEAMIAEEIGNLNEDVKKGVLTALLVAAGKEDGIILNKQFFSNNKIENLKSICNSLVENYKDHNLSVDDGGLEKNSNSFSKYYYLPNFKNKLTDKVLELYNALYSNEELIIQLKFLAGLNLRKDGISVHISKVKGKLLSDDWHSDCFSHTAKSFLYLQNIEKNNSPFCFLRKSHANKKLKMLNEKENSKKILKINEDKTKTWDQIWNKLEDSNYKNEIFNNSDPIECSYPKGTLITCDTSGFHKKGFSGGVEERFMIGFVSKRGSMFEKFKSAFF